MKIGILSQWYPPEPGPASLPGELARELARRGHQVQVVTGFPNYPSGHVQAGYSIRPRTDEVVDGVSVRRVALLPSHSDHAIGRVANYASFGASAMALGVDTLLDCDVVWVSNSPPTVGWAMQRLRRAGVPMILHVMDLWPDNLIASGMAGTGRVNRTATAVAAALARTTYDCADRVLAISPSVVDLLESRDVPRRKLDFVPLWANESVFKPTSGEAVRVRMGVPESMVVILYAGAIGTTQDLEALIQAVGMLPSELHDQAECWIVGDGVGTRALSRIVATLPESAPAVRLVGRRPMEEMPAWTAAADICYVGLRPDDHARFTLPSKVQTTAAMAKPILASVPGDVDQLVKELGLGFSSGGQGVTPLATELQRAVAMGRQGLAALGKEARTQYWTHFSLSAGIDRIESLAATLAGRTTPALPEVHGVTVEPALRSDIRAVVDVHMRSFQGFFLTFLGPRFLNLFYDDLRTQPGARLLVAKRAGSVVGFVGGVLDEDGYSAGLKQRKAPAFARAALGALARDPHIAPRLWRARMRGAAGETNPVPATLLSIAVAPDVQGAGIGRSLLGAFRTWLTEVGVDQFTLTTDAVDNAAAIHFYEASRLRRVREFETPEGRRMIQFAGETARVSQSDDSSP